MVKKTKKILFYSFLSLLVGLIAVAGFVYFQLSDLEKVKGLVVEKLEDMTGRKINIGSAKLDFYRGVGIRLEDVSLGGLSDGRPEFKARSVRVVTKLLPLLNQQIEIQQLVISGSSLLLVRDVEGKLNFAGRRDQQAKPADTGLFKVLKVSLAHRLIVDQGEIEFIDHYRQDAGKPIVFSVKNFYLAVSKQLLQSPFNFTVSGEIPSSGAPTLVMVAGSFDDPDASQNLLDIPIRGNLKINDLDVPSFRPYFQRVSARAPRNSKLSLESSFSGKLGGPFRSEGMIKFHSPDRQGAVLRNMETPHRGALNYDIDFGNDTITFNQLKVKSGPFESSMEGSLSRLSSDDPALSFSIETSPFLIDKTHEYFPLTIFPQGFHDWINGLFQHGRAEIKLLKFDGTLNQLRTLSIKDVSEQVTGELVLNQVDWRSPLPALKRVNGSLKLQDGIGKVEISKARYDDLPIGNIHGQIEYRAKGPVADLSLENKVDLNQFKKTLKKILAKTPFKNVLDDYADLKGTGVVSIGFKGSLDASDPLSLTAKLSMENVSLFEKELRHRVENLSGVVRYTHIPGLKEKSKLAWTPFFKFEKLSGNFGSSSFSGLQGEVALENEKPMLSMSVLYKLNAKDLPGLVKDMDSETPVVALLQEMHFLEGDVEVDYHSKENVESPESIEEWGKIGLKKISLKYPKKYQPLLNFSGNIAFGGDRLRLENISGWYGDSPIQLGGELLYGHGNSPDFSLRVVSSDFNKSDLNDFPVLRSLDFAGPAQISVKLNGTPKSFRFRHALDLTRISYQVGGAFAKPQNAPNQVEMWGRYSAKNGFSIDGLEYELGGNKITGEGTLASLEAPVFSMKLKGEGFKLYPVAQFFGPLKFNQDGVLDFEIQGNGNLNRFDETKVKGLVKLKQLVFKPPNYPGTLAVDAHVLFADDVYDIQMGKLKSDRSNIFFSGSYLAGVRPVLDLMLYGKELSLDELLGGGDEGKGGMKALIEGTNIFSKGETRVALNLNQMDYNFLKLKNVAGNFSFRNNVFRVQKLRVGSGSPVRAQGTISMKESEPVRFTSRIWTKDSEAESLIGLFGDKFKKCLSGNLKNLTVNLRGEGSSWNEIRHTLTGVVSVHLAPGDLDHDELKQGFYRLFDVPGDAAPKQASAESDRSHYEQISGRFTFTHGVAETENFVFESKEGKTSVVGMFDLAKNTMDTVMGVAPLPGLDKFLTKIPVVGKIITGGDEESLVKNYYNVKGPFGDPEISSVPFTSLGKKVMGIFQGILQAPTELFPFSEPEVTN